MNNLLVIMVDCLRQDRFEGDGKTAHIPNLDAFKQRAYSFDNAHGVGSNTSSVMGSWFTGLYPFRNGIRSFFDRQFKPEVQTLASVLQTKGYRTLATVTDALEHGEDVLGGFSEIERRDKKKETIYSGYGERVCQQLADLNQSSDPWFYFVHTAELHHRRQCEAKFRKSRYGKSFYDRTLSCVDHYLGKILEGVDLDNTLVVIFGDHGDNVLFETPLFATSYVINRLRADKSLPGALQFRELCHKVGLMTQWKWILRHNPLFHHDYHVYRFLTHAPLMISLPGQTQPQRISTAVSSVDLFSTLLDCLNISVAHKTDGISFYPTMLNPDATVADRVLYQEVATEPGLLMPSQPDEPVVLMRAVLENNWKLVVSALANAQPELYDLSSDPDELHNVYQNSENATLVVSLHQKLNDLCKSTLSLDTEAELVHS